MAESRDSLSPVEGHGLRVYLDRAMHIASLRYFDRSGPIAQTVQTNLGVPLPQHSRATSAVQLTGRQPIVLAWRSPTETLLLCTDETLLNELEDDIASSSDGCLIVQSGGAWVLRANGERIADLLARMGGQGGIPNPGEARRSRLADIPVFAIQASSGEILLVAERIYAEHLLSWLRACAQDLEIS